MPHPNDFLAPTAEQQAEAELAEEQEVEHALDCLLSLPSRWAVDKCFQKADCVNTASAFGTAATVVDAGVSGEHDEARYAIETDNDLVAYLHTAKELAGEKVIFLIELSGGYA